MARLKVYTLSALTGLALVFGGAAVIAPSVFAPNAIAQSSPSAGVTQTIDAAKDAGRIGEQADGYLGAVTSLNATEQAAMDEINILRKSAYTKIARDKGVSVEDVAKLTAEKLVAKAPSGHMIRDGFGKWVKK